MTAPSGTRILTASSGKLLLPDQKLTACPIETKEKIPPQTIGSLLRNFQLAVLKIAMVESHQNY